MLKLVGLFIFCFNVLFCSTVVSKTVVLKKMKKFSNARNGNHGMGHYMLKVLHGVGCRGVLGCDVFTLIFLETWIQSFPVRETNFKLKYFRYLKLYE